MVDDYAGLPRRMRWQRAKLGVTQAAAARLIGCSQQYLSDVEHGRKGLTLQRLCRIAEAYNVTTDYLLGREVCDG